MSADYPQLFRTFLDRSSTVYFSYRVADRQVVYVSPAYEQVFGDPAAHVNEDLPLWLARVHPDDLALLREYLAQVLAGALVQQVEVRVNQPDGSLQWLLLAACREYLAEDDLYLSGTVQDITRPKEVSINSEKFNTKKDATLEILSHDLSAPLALLQQLTEHLRAESPEASEAALHLLHLMERTCADGVNLIRDFVDNEFMESANVELKRERADLAAWLGTLLVEYQRSEWHTHLQFDYTVAEQPIYVSFDINKLQQVINNLISNAIKFTPDGGRISVAVARQAEKVLITVADTGIGIPAQLQAQLFDRFTKARRPGLRGEKTNGLGMSIIRLIVALHHGHITFESTEGQGTTFTITLPALPA
ncbi:MAG: PAS domain-containing sensor histidine kinase [Janthinobacterium lividum]